MQLTTVDLPVFSGVCAAPGRNRRDEALRLFTGLNILPKKSFAASYSYRTQRPQQQQLRSGWVQALAPVLFPQASAFALDFHPIPFRGDPSGLDNHFLPMRGKAGSSILTLFAQEHDSRVLCYANANLVRADQAQTPPPKHPLYSTRPEMCHFWPRGV